MRKIERKAVSGKIATTLLLTGVCSVLLLSMFAVTPIQSQEEPLYVDLSYLVSHVEEFNGYYVMTNGTVEYYYYIGAEGPDFELEPPDGPGIGVEMLQDLSYPPRGSKVVVAGWVNYHMGVERSWWAIAGSWWFAPPPGDLDGDGYVGPIDLNMFAAAYGKQAGQIGYNPYADLEYDRYIDPVDLSIFAACYGKQI